MKKITLTVTLLNYKKLNIKNSIKKYNSFSTYYYILIFPLDSLLKTKLLFCKC